MSDRLIRWGSQIIGSAGGDLFKTNLYDLKDRMLGYWKMDEKSDTSLYDVNNNYNLRLNNNASLNNESKVGFDTCIWCASINQYATCENIGYKLVPGGYGWSISFWVKLPQLPSDKNMSYSRVFYTDKTDITFRDSGGSANKLLFADREEFTYKQVFVYANTNVSTNVWEHYVCTAEIGDMRIYRNGINVSGTTVIPTKPFYPGDLMSNKYATFGGGGGIGYHLNGYLDEVGIWNRALSPEEVSTLYNNGNGLTYPF